jgi:hypothetical protein
VDGYLPSSEGGSTKKTPTISKEFQAILERSKKKERMVKQSQSKSKQSSREKNLMKSKDITNVSLQEVLTSKKKISINPTSKYTCPQECTGTNG